MNQNPFSAAVDETQNPWSVASSAQVVDEAKESTLREMEGTVAAAAALTENVKKAKKEGNHLFLRWAAQQAALILKSIALFIRRAIELAIFKFVLELCAMVMKSLMEALTKKGYSAMDVSTKGVVYHGDNPAPSTGKSGSFGSNPFESTSFGRPW